MTRLLTGLGLALVLCLGCEVNLGLNLSRRDGGTDARVPIPPGTDAGRTGLDAGRPRTDAGPFDGDAGPPTDAGPPRDAAAGTDAGPIEECATYRSCAEYVLAHPGDPLPFFVEIDPLCDGNGVRTRCRLDGAGAAWTLVAGNNGTDASPFNCHAGSDADGRVGDLAVGCGRLSVPDIRAITGSTPEWLFECGGGFAPAYRAYVRNREGIWTFERINPYNWETDRNLDGVFEHSANRSGYVFSDYQSQRIGHANYAASRPSEGNGCYVEGPGWGQPAFMWMR